MTETFTPPARRGPPIVEVREVFTLLRLGHALVRRDIAPGAAASVQPTYYIRIESIERPVSNPAATAAIKTGRIGHGFAHPDGMQWKQTTRTA
jgi:hypothetical protein